MSDKQVLLNCFGDLQERLYSIQRGEDIRAFSLQQKRSVIECIIQNGILKTNHEDAIDFLDIMLEKISAAAELDLTNTINRIDQQEKTINPFTFNEEPNTFNDTERKKLVSDIQKELEYYRRELVKLKDEINKNLNSLGTNKFSNAGFKLKMDLSVEEISEFFRALLECGILQSPSSESLTKKELANFISQNFVGKTKPSISATNLHNSITSKRTFSRNIEKLFARLHKHVTSDNQ